MDKNEKTGAIGGGIGALLLSPLTTGIIGLGIWGYGSVEEDKKWKQAGKGVLIGTGIVLAAEIVLALAVIAVAVPGSAQYENAAATLAKNGIKVPPRTV